MLIHSAVNRIPETQAANQYDLGKVEFFARAGQYLLLINFGAGRESRHNAADKFGGIVHVNK